MRRHLLMLWIGAFTLLCHRLYAQEGQPISYCISIVDHAYEPGILSDGNTIQPVFKQPALNSIASRYTFTAFQKAYPASRYEHLLQMYFITVSNYNFINEIKAAYPDVFVGGYPYTMPQPLYTPNDFGKVYGGVQTELDLIEAKRAWDIQKGNPNITLGLTDTYVLRAHDELNGKVSPNYAHLPSGMNIEHGTWVAGIMAGKTDNDTGLSAIGFNCSLSDATLADSSMSRMSKDGIRVLNASWRLSIPCQTTFNLSGYADKINLYNEMYENGTTVVAAAGNGNAPNYYNPCGFEGYEFPADYDHNISVTSVGHKKPRYPFNPNIPDSNFQDYHRFKYGTSDSEIHNYNYKVDLSAPGYRIKAPAAINWVSGVIGHEYSDNISGTSFAAPMVSGAVGLMLSQTNCLSPYQVEYVLKTQSVKIDTIPANLPYLGKLGVGRLNAFNVVDFLRQRGNGFCNDPATQTMYVTGVHINTLCAPSQFLNTVRPKLNPIIVNGTPPYTYRWYAIDGNTTRLDDSTIGSPTVVYSTGANIVYYVVQVTDASTVPKVASKVVKVKLKTGGWDLAMRDSYTDMLDEPCLMSTVDPRDWQIWQSPDIWNRQAKDGDTVHMNPEYFNTDSNYLYVRIRNVGCDASPAPGTSGTKLKLYWTKAAASEKWSVDWVNGTGANPADGGEITKNKAIDIPVIQPGQTVKLVRGWRPPKPQDYDPNLKSFEVCVLARIETQTTAPYGMYVPELTDTNVKWNVGNNNNIVTRNLIVDNYNTGNRGGTRRIYVGNADGTTKRFSLQVLNNKDIHKHFAGNLSEYMYAVIKLDNTVWSRWVSGGSMGQYGTVDNEKHTISYDPATPLRLDNITFNPNEKFPVDISFVIRDGVTVPFDVQQQEIHFRQLAKESSDQDEYVYGNVTFQFNIAAMEGTGNKRSGGSGNIMSNAKAYTIYPNPTSNSLNIVRNTGSGTATLTITDITGRIMLSATGINLNSDPYRVNVAGLPTGVYFVKIAGSDGGATTEKVIIQH